APPPGPAPLPLGGDDVFTALLDDGDARDAALLDDELGDEGIGLDRKIRPLEHRSQIADRGTAAAATADRHLIDIDSFLMTRIEIGIEWHSEFSRAFDEGL